MTARSDAIDDIVSIESGARAIRQYAGIDPSLTSGEIIGMKDGSKWFHPNDGSRPARLHHEEQPGAPGTL